MKIKKIVVCGGHLAPALAVIQLLLKRKDYKIFYIGRKNPAEGDKAISLEYLAISKLKIPFYSLNTGRFPRYITWYTLLSLAKLPLALVQSLYFLLKIEPKMVLSFGGYVALPVCFSAWLLRIPVVTHEQTHILGLANRIICRFAKVVCLSWPDTEYVPKGVKTVIVGNPIREDVLFPVKTSMVNFGNKDLPLLYVTGGSLGSRSINQIVGEVLPYLITRFRIIHQCGSTGEEVDFKLLSKLKNSLPAETSQNYWLVTHINPSHVGSILHNADLVICRSGANTVAEIAAVGVPAICIPLPWAADKEQERNAKMLEDLGFVKILKQKQATPEELINTIEPMMKNFSKYQKSAPLARALIRPDANKLLTGVLESYL